MTTLGGLSAQRDGTFAIFAEGQAVAVPGALVSANYFDVIGVAPAGGRFFLEREERTATADPVVVISDALWQRLYKRDPSAIGRALTVNGTAAHVIGIARSASWACERTVSHLWVPMSMAELVLRDRDGRPARLERANDLFLDYVGRRRTDVTIEQVSPKPLSSVPASTPHGRTAGPSRGHPRLAERPGEQHRGCRSRS